MGQLARLEENFVADFKSSIKIASRCSRPCCFFYWNLFPLDLIKDEFAREPGPVRGSHSGSSSPALSCNPTLGPKLVPALIPSLVPALAPPSFNELFKQFMRAYLELNQGPR